ncbi:EF-hand calcium-binding domain-containing protein 9-like [Aplochiton taeniatus]
MKLKKDIQFYHFMCHVTDLKKKEIKMTFDMLDWDACGEIGFEQFYMLVCILLSSEYHVEKNFIFRHSRPVFELLDMDGGRTISPAEFQASGFLFNLKGRALNKIFHEFDVSGDENLNYKEFKMFTMACIDMQEENKQKTQKWKFKRVDNIKTNLQARRNALPSSTGIQDKAHPDVPLEDVVPKAGLQDGMWGLAHWLGGSNGGQMTRTSATAGTMALQ